jgi:hypothetical protein
VSSFKSLVKAAGRYVLAAGTGERLIERCGGAGGRPGKAIRGPVDLAGVKQELDLYLQVGRQRWRAATQVPC